MKLKVAAYQTQYNSFSVIVTEENGECWADGNPDYVRVTESIEVDFKELSHDSVVSAQLKSLDAQEQKARADFAVALMNIEDRRQKLLALPAEV